MATSIGNDISNPLSAMGSAPAESSSREDILVCLPPLSHEAREAALAVILAVFPGDSLLVAVTETQGPASNTMETPLVVYEDARSHSSWALCATDYLAAANIARKHRKKHVLLLGGEVPSIELLKDLAQGIATGNADVVLPRPKIGPHDGLVNSALLYPLTRTLFGHDIRFPLPHNIGLSQRAVERFASEAQREASAGKLDSLLWPVSIAGSSGLSVRQIDTDEHIPGPPALDFNRLFTEVIGSLLADTEARAIFWQRSRYIPPTQSTQPPPAPSATEPNAEAASMLDGFRVAYANLLPIWSLVLPPQSLLALKKLSLAPPEAFLFPPELWARIVYDFALAFHLRTLNRNHLVGALIPLYLAWAASYIASSPGEAAEAERLVQRTAMAFDSERPYFVSRWRWPDRFNP